MHKHNNRGLACLSSPPHTNPITTNHHHYHQILRLVAEASAIEHGRWRKTRENTGDEDDSISNWRQDRYRRLFFLDPSPSPADGGHSNGAANGAADAGGGLPRAEGNSFHKLPPLLMPQHSIQEGAREDEEEEGASSSAVSADAFAFVPAAARQGEGGNPQPGPSPAPSSSTKPSPLNPAAAAAAAAAATTDGSHRPPPSPSSFARWLNKRKGPKSAMPLAAAHLESSSGAVSASSSAAASSLGASSLLLMRKQTSLSSTVDLKVKVRAATACV